VYEKQGDLFKDPTAEDYQQALSVYVKIAYEQMDAKRYDEAMAALNKAMKIDSDSPKLNTALAKVYQLQGEYEKSDKVFKKVIRHNRDYTDAYLQYGLFLFQRERYEEACEQFTRASEDDFYPSRAAAYFNLGVCHREQGQFDDAEAAFEHCLGLQPGNVDVLLELSDLKNRSQDYPESKQYFDRYVAAMRKAGVPLSARALWLGIQLERQFDNKDAESSLILLLKNNHPYSSEYLEYKKSLK
jgi:type IV pilus assembly protein PilF